MIPNGSASLTRSFMPAAETTRNQLLVWIIQQINAVRNNSEWQSIKFDTGSGHDPGL